MLNYSGGHAFNLLILRDGLYIFEPQTGEFWTPEELDRLSPDYKRLYKVNGEVVLI